MKIILSIMAFILFAMPVAAQTPRVIAEVAASSDKTVKNSPFSAEAVSESVQVLADGNRIVRSTTSKLYRNSEGRFRREITGGVGGSGTLFSTGSGITILDPVQGYRYMLDPNMRTARIAGLLPGHAVSVVSTRPASPEQRALLERKLSEATRAEGRTPDAPGPPPAPRPPDAPSIAVVGAFPAPPAPPAALAVPFGVTSASKYDSQTEDLGTRDLEGVSAHGQLTRTTIPAGAIGNERPIETTYERWYSQELELVVYSKNYDPRFGEQTYKLTNIVRAEPDPSLFSVPQGYRFLSEPGAVYRLKETQLKAEEVKAAKAAAGKKP